MSGQLTLASLFCGAGGLDLGFERAGFKTVWGNDNYKPARIVWESLFDGKFDPRDIREIPAKDIPRADVVAGGFPCQPFSSQGKMLGVADPRGGLFMECLRVIAVTRPRAVLLENVPLLHGKPIENAIVSSLRALDYGVETRVLGVWAYGVPQTRKRWILMAHAGRLDPIFPNPTHGPGTGNPTPTAGDVLLGLPEPSDTTEPEQIAIDGAVYSTKWKNDKREIKLDALGPTIISRTNWFRRLSAEHGGKNEPGLPERRPTVRECALLQGFPRDFRFMLPGISKSAAYQMIANAVPPPLAYALARALAERMRHGEPGLLPYDALGSKGAM
jgi:DNA (cytosine-5)-methyltransferase 1